MYSKLRNDNSGITLVEVIVSMLILAIIVIPLLSSFVLSSRVNLKSRNKQYATILGQNVMEGIKNYDLDEIARQFNGIIATGGAFSIVPESSFAAGTCTHGLGYYETDDSFHLLSLTEPVDQNKISIAKKATGEVYFKGNDEETYYYVLNGVQEGTKRFDVRIQISSKNYQGDVATGAAIKQNQYEIPDVTNLDVNETAIINPASAGIQYKQDVASGYELNENDDTYTIINNHTFDVAALDYFSSEHQAYRNYAIHEANAAIPPNPDIPSEVSREDLQRKISRKTMITITDLEVEGKNRILVTATLEYKFREGEDVLYKTGTADTSNSTKLFGGFYEQVAFDTLDQIYLFHTPLKYGEWDSSIGDVIIIDNHSSHLGDDLKVYIAQQSFYGVAGGGFDNIEPIQVKATGEFTHKIKFYYNRDKSRKELESADGSYNLQEGTNYFKTLVTNGATKDRIYEVKVQVYEQGSIELLNELSSTFTR